MFPVILEIGSFSLKSFGLMCACGFAAGWFFMKKFSMPIAGVDREALPELLSVIMLGGVFGARAAYVMEHWTAEFSGRPLADVLRFDRGGLMFYGGLVLAVLFLAGYSLLRKKSFLSLVDLAAIALPLGHAFGRIGCFLNGCCFGKTSASVISVSYPRASHPWHCQLKEGLIGAESASSLPVLPSQLIEAGLNICLFAVLLKFASGKKRPAGFLAGVYLVSYGLIRFYTETLRSDDRLMVGRMTIAQTICLAVIPLGALLLLYARRRPKSSCDAKGK